LHILSVSVCVSVASVMQHPNRMRRITLPSVAWLYYNLPPCLVNGFIFGTEAESGWNAVPPDSAWKRSSKTCLKLTSAECAVENSWWWAEKMPETFRVL
jgi:hypothetical protein